eukprot:CAMPEP_0198298428 /NCGR_PEP_ID=MMETSP1449-20131203/40873_1 /TAXON_ID=420275 /ORGANISM="Attheya septentrionalis, Strain CCMP2084" /LENGTH=325 /DNA_ID=CAMNT_0043999687 /DNA_START=190 /DNA_END=1163 /DNA_ORIENTATION=+
MLSNWMIRTRCITSTCGGNQRWMIRSYSASSMRSSSATTSKEGDSVLVNHGGGTGPSGKRVWKATEHDVTTAKAAAAVADGDRKEDDSSTIQQQQQPQHWWNESIACQEDRNVLLDRVGRQEREGGRMRQAMLGVLREDPVEDMRLLTDNYTVPALASALRDREDALQWCASLLKAGKMEELERTLRPFERRYVEQRRKRLLTLDLKEGFGVQGLELLRKGLGRMPRRVSQAHQKRAGVVVALCNVHGVPAILLEKRSRHLRAHPDEVCLPGGMVSTSQDSGPNDPSIVSTCLREMHEEISGLSPQSITVLGVLRCNWGEVHHLT